MTLNTSKTRSLPNADDWQTIQRFRDLPILASTRSAFQKALRKASLSFDSLAKIAEQDPAVCLHMLLRIQQRSPASIEQISSAAGCISLLGMEEVVRLVKQLPALDHWPQGRSERNYMESLHSAVLAGNIAAQWAHFKPGLNQHQAQWAAMLASAPLWLWQLRQVSASQNSFNQLSQGKDIIAAIEFSFGALSKSRLLQWKKLALQLALPNICQSLWQSQCWPKAKEWQVLRKQPLTQIDGHRALKLQCQQPELLIYFANALANQYRFGIYRYKSLRWLTLSAHFLGQDTHKIHQDVIRLCLQLAQQGRLTTSINSLLAPRHCSLPESTSYQCITPLLDSQLESSSTTAAGRIQERKIDRKLLTQLIRQLNETPESFADWHDLMKSVLKGITEGIGLNFAYIMIKNARNETAKVYYQQGLAADDPLSHLSVTLDNTSVFKKMLEKPASVMVTNQNRDKMLRGISTAQKSVLPQQFMMMSLFSNKRPIGIIFADLGNLEHNSPMSPAEYAAFKSLCMATNKSLGKLAHSAQTQAAVNNRKANQH